MHGHSTKYAGEIIDFDELYQAMEAIEADAPGLGWYHRISGQTAAARATGRVRGELREERTAHAATTVRLRAAKQALEACQAGEPHPGDCVDEDEAARVIAHTKSIAWHEGQIEDEDDH
jgi:hypothetical protein